MIKPCLFALSLFAASASIATAEIKFLKPGDKPLTRQAAPKTEDFDLNSIYRGIDMLSRV